MKRALSPRFFQREQISLVLFHETSLGCVETTRLSARGRNTTQANLFAVPPLSGRADSFPKKLEKSRVSPELLLVILLPRHRENRQSHLYLCV
jgi:hypothetical protein